MHILRKNHNPLFSIITTCYNCEKYILNAIHSVVAQTCSDYEYIIIDDGSTDESGKLIDNASNSVPRIKVIHQSNQWVYAAMNRGVKEAIGEYVLIVNSDDLLHEDILSIVKNKIEKYDHPDVIWTKVLCHRVDENQNIIEYDVYNFDNMVQEERYFSSKKECRESWLFLFDKYLTNNPHNVYKRELMIDHPFRNDIYGADTYFNACIASDIKTALLIKEVAVDVLEYDSINMNISVGNYYPYEHKMFSEIIQKHLDCYNEWGMESKDITNYFCERRLKYLSGEFEGLCSSKCNLSLSEKIKRIMENFLDDYIFDLATETGQTDKLIGRVVRGLIRVMGDERLSDLDRYSFLNHIVDVATQKEPPDERRLREAVLNPLNPRRVGGGMYERIYGVRVDEG